MDRTLKPVNALNVAIVGGGPGCKAIMDMIFTETLSQLRMKLIGVACTNPNAPGYRYAQEKGLYTTLDYRDLYRLKDLNMIIEVTGREEVADLPLETQALLLRFLQDKSFERVGGQHPVHVNVRIIAATNRKVENEIEAGHVREDFYYRLNVVPIQVPP